MPIRMMVRFSARVASKVLGEVFGTVADVGNQPKCEVLVVFCSCQFPCVYCKCTLDGTQLRLFPQLCDTIVFQIFR
jgi:hypothetical protein